MSTPQTKGGGRGEHLAGSWWTPSHLACRYESFEDPTGTVDKFHYGTHYSNAAGVMHYLIRTEPFTTLHIQLQSGRWAPGRRIPQRGHRGDSQAPASRPVPPPGLTARTGSSTRCQRRGKPAWRTRWMSRSSSRSSSTSRSSWRTRTVRDTVVTAAGSVAESVSFTLPVLPAGFDLGCLQLSNEKVGDVVLPRWARSREDFIHQHRKALVRWGSPSIPGGVPGARGAAPTPR